jgi:hypothetical protein
LEIGTFVVHVTGDEEEFLFETNVGYNFLVADVEAEVLEETLSVLGEGHVGAKEGGLFVEGGTVVGDEGRRDEDGVSAEEYGGGGVDGEVTTGLVGGAESSIGIRGSIRFTLDQHLAIEIKLDIIGSPIELHHHILNLTRLAVTNPGRGHGLEPVAVGVRSTVHGPDW